MSFSLEINTLIQRYLKEAKNQELTLIEIDQRPHHKKVWNYWKAKAYYKIDNFYERLSDVPEGLTDYWIVADEVATQYFTWNGNNIEQKNTKETCKKIYGG